MNRVGVKLSYEEFSKVKSKFIVRSYGFQNKLTSLNAYVSYRKTKSVYVAHHKALELFKNVKCNIPDGNTMVWQEPILLKLRPHQKKVIKYLFEHIFTSTKIKNGSASLNMELKMGLGKTYIAIGLTLLIKKKTLIIVPANLIDDPWIETFNKLCPNIIIGEYSGKRKIDGQVIIASRDSLLSDTMTYKDLLGNTHKVPKLEYMKQFGLTIIDEVHTLCTKSRSSIFRCCKSLRTIAMSGTCNHRLNKMDKIAHLYFGPPVIMKEVIPELEKLVDMSHLVVNVHKILYHGPDEFTKPLLSVHGISHPKMTSQVIKDPYRNKLIVNLAKRLVEQNHATFIFLDRLELIELLLENLSKEMPDIGIDAPELKKMFSVKNGTSKDEKIKAKTQGMLTLVTYGCASIGLSYDRYTAIIFANSRRNGFLQINDRIFRLDGPKDKSREFYYIVDDRTAMGKQYSGFKKAIKDTYKANWYEEKYSYKEI